MSSLHRQLVEPGPTASATLVQGVAIRKIYKSRDAGKAAKKGVIRALDGVDLEVASGENVGLIGESGSGKSTLGRILLGLTRPTDGQVHFDGHDVVRAHGAELVRMRSRMNLVFQNPHAAVNRRRQAIDVVRQPLSALKIGPANERSDRAAQALVDVGVPERMWYRYPHELSGGQLQRVVIARALVSDPDFVVADEPTASLDVSIRAQIVNLLSDLQERRNIAMLFISHDLRTVSHIADRIAVMYLGRLVEVGDRDQISRSPQHPYTIRLIDSMPRLGGRPQDTQRRAGLRIDATTPVAGCPYYARCPLAVQQCAVTAPPLEAKADGRLVACHLLPAASADRTT
jgi:oligopeptide/dipeptide ABC transporter ATP-binding protein